MLAKHLASFASPADSAILGMTIDASTARISTTNRTSTNVKPFVVFILFSFSEEFKLKSTAL